MERSIRAGLVAFRWAAWVWMAAVALTLHDELVRPWIAWTALAAALGVTVASTVSLRRRPNAPLSRAAAAAEVAVGLCIVVVDGWAYATGHVFGSSQTLGVVWPLIGVLAVGLACGPLLGALAGFAFAGARLLDAATNGVSITTGHRVLSALSTGLVYGLVGAVMGYIVTLLRQAREEVAAATAREELARTLHDGVLQTLAVIERRTNEPETARLAREQERELRHFLFSPIDAQAHNANLAVALRRAVDRFETTYDARCDLLIVGDVPDLAHRKVDALAGAVGEALTNAGKHGGSSRVTVFVETDETGHVFCSVKDNGTGFDSGTVTEGIGLSRSVRGRIGDVGGRVEVRATPGDGAEVCMWLR